MKVDGAWRILAIHVILTRYEVALNANFVYTNEDRFQGFEIAMVKNSQPRPGAFPRPRPPINADGSTRQKPGTKPNLDTLKSARLIMRMHPDLVDLIDLRASEKAMSRSKMIEQILVGYLAADPRNPKISPVGKIDRSLMKPTDFREQDPHRFAARWQRFVAAHTAIFGTAPPLDYEEDLERYWSPYGGDGSVEQDQEVSEDGRAAAWAQKSAAKSKKK